MAKLTAKEYYELEAVFIDLLNVETEFSEEDISDISFRLLKALSEENIVNKEEVFDYSKQKPEPTPLKGDATQLEFDPEIHL